MHRCHVAALQQPSTTMQEGYGARLAAPAGASGAACEHAVGVAGVVGVFQQLQLPQVVVPADGGLSSVRWFVAVAVLVVVVVAMVVVVVMAVMVQVMGSGEQSSSEGFYIAPACVTMGPS